MDDERREELEAEGFAVGVENPIEELTAKCVDCGETTRAMTTVWLTKDDEGNAVPKDDVSFRCSGCGEITTKDIRVTKRGDEPWIRKR